MNITVKDKKLRTMIKQAVSEALEENIEKLKLGLIPHVSDKEMSEIRKICGSPERYKSQEFKRIDL